MLSYTREIPSHHKLLLEKLNIQRCCEDFCDVTVVIQRMRFRAHRCILSAASSRLLSMVKLMKGVGQELTLEEVSPQGFKIVLEYMYTGVLWVPADCLKDVSSTAVYLHMDEVIECCSTLANCKDQAVVSPRPDDESRQDLQDTSVNLPVLDCPLGGILNTNTASKSTGSSNLAGNTGSNVSEDKKNVGCDQSQHNSSTYPDQDALSEISVQNEDDVMYEGNQSTSEYPYNHYVPPIEQTFSPRPMPKMMTSHMTILPSMLSSQAFFQEQAQFPIDAAYYMSQPSQFYAGNFIQDQGSNTAPQNYMSDSDRQRLVTDYHSSSNYQHSTPSLNYTAADYSDTCNVYGDISELGSGVDRDLQHLHNNVYTNPNSSSKHYSTGSSKASASQAPSQLKQGESSETKTSMKKLEDVTPSQRYTTISPVNSPQPLIEAVSPYNPDTEMPVPTPQEKSIGAKFEYGATVNVIESGVSTSEASDLKRPTHFSSRPAARMPPKKAGYRGIESDYNRHFNMFSHQYSSASKTEYQNKEGTDKTGVSLQSTTHQTNQFTHSVAPQSKGAQHSSNITENKAQHHSTNQSYLSDLSLPETGSMAPSVGGCHTQQSAEHIQTKKMVASQKAAKAAGQTNTQNKNRANLNECENKESNQKTDLNTASHLASYSSLPDVGEMSSGLSLEQSSLYAPQPHTHESDKSVNMVAGFTPTKNNNMTELVDSIEDVLRLIHHGSDTSPTKNMSVSQPFTSYSTQHMTLNQNNYTLSNSTQGAISPSTGHQVNQSSRAVDQNNGGMKQNTSAGVNHTSSGTVNHATNGIVEHSTQSTVSLSTNSGVSLRKTILDVLSQECFDDDSELSTGSKEHGTSALGGFKKQENVPLTTLLKMVPFDKSKGAETASLTQYADVSSSQEQSARLMCGASATVANDDDLVGHFEDIDSASDGGSDYNLVIDFDKEIHDEDEDHRKQNLNTNTELSLKLNDMHSESLKTSKPQHNSPRSNTVENKSENNKPNVEKKTRKKPMINIPKYALTTAYCDPNDTRQGNRSNRRHSYETSIVKPLKKRIKFKLMMKKIQEQKPVTRQMLQKKQPNRHIKYICELCERQFYDKYKAFAQHMQDHNRKLLNFCNVCGMGYKRLEDLSKHRSTNHSLLSFQCRHCNEVFDNVLLYKKHCVNEHQDTKPFYCLYEACTYTTEHFNILEKHTLIHSEDKQFQCPHCWTKFSQPNGLRAHLVSCMNMQTYSCTLCSKTFNRNQGLKEHMRCHSDVKKHTCSECGASFNDVRNFKRHCRKHNSEPKFTCRHCGSKFNYSNVLKRHMVKKHPDKEQVEFGKKGAKNKESVLIKNYLD